MMERNVQVLRVFQVYQNAQEVALWLGDGDKSSDLAMQELSKGDLFHADSIGRGRMAAFESLLQRVYWCRVWIVQEIAAGDVVRVYCGRYSVDWRCIEELVTAPSFRDARFPSARNLVRIRREWSMTPPSLLELLLYTSKSRSEKPHDKVFGLLGLASDQRHFVPEPKYQLNPSQLCESITLAAFGSKRSLDIIFLASQQQGTSSGISLPSWCPDYLNVGSKPFDKAMAMYIARKTSKIRAGARGVHWEAAYDSVALIRMNPAQNKIIVRGASVGKVKSLGAVLDEKGHGFPKNQADSSAITRDCDDARTYQSICRLLLIYDSSYSVVSQKSTIPSCLDKFPLEMFSLRSGHNAETARNWFKRNQSLSIQGKTLERWVACSKSQEWLNLEIQELMEYRHLSIAVAESDKGRHAHDVTVRWQSWLGSSSGTA